MNEKLMSNPFYVKALEFIKNNDLASLENGKHVIDGDNLWVNIVESKLKTKKEARLEVHDKYIDIQVPLSGPETFGVASRSECVEPDGEMDSEKDILFFKDAVDKTVNVKAGESITFAPEDAHAPLIATRCVKYPLDADNKKIIRKAIFKVKVN